MKQIQSEWVEPQYKKLLKTEEQQSWWLYDLLHFFSFQWVFPPFG